jgi:hypothetical protein
MIVEHYTDDKGKRLHYSIWDQVVVQPPIFTDFKETVAPDFLPAVFPIRSTHLGPQFTP